MVCIQERLVIKSSLWWGGYSIWISYNFQILIQKTNTIRGNMVCKFIHSYSSSDIITFSSGQDGIWLSLKFLLANFFLSILPCYFSYTYVFFSQSSPAHSPQPKINFSYYKYAPRPICLLICGATAATTTFYFLKISGGSPVSTRGES